MGYDEQGFELAHRTFAGNQSDSTSLVTMVESLRQAAGYPESAELLPAAKVLVIVDAGVATAGNLKLLAKAQRALGKLRARAARVQRFYQVELKDPAHLRAGLTWQRKDEVRAEDEPLLGCYVLRTDRSELSAERLWELYVLLSRAEDGFAALKGDLGLRPNYHQLEGRVDAHIFLTVLAYQLLRFIT